MAPGPDIRHAQFTAKTVDEAIEVGLRTLGLSVSDVEVTVRQKHEAKLGLFKSKAVVSIAYDEEQCRRRREEAEVEQCLTLRYAPMGFTLKIDPVPEGLQGRLPYVTTRFLSRNHVPGFERDIVEQLIREQSGEPQVVFGPGVVELEGVRASVYLSPSEMEGYYLQYDRGEVSGEALREALARRGIVRGVLDGAVESVTRGSYTVGLPIVVARGKPARDELAPALEYRFDPDKIHLTFKEDTSVDFRDVMRLSFVRKEEALVLKRERTPGENGWTVTGKEVHFKVEPEQPFPRGTNTYVTENGRELRAAIDGHVEVRDGLVCVGQVFVIKGDVDYHTGHIEFDGSVMIGGDVKPEFEVKAKGNVEVFGSVDDAIIEAGGDVTVQFGVFAKGHGRVRAQGHVRARHFENVTVEAGRIYVAANAVNCGLYAREIVEVTGKPGTLVGGVTTARDYVFANTIGSELGTRTEVVVGDPAECDAQIEELKGLIRNESDEEELGALRAKLREAEEARRRLAMAKCHVFDRLYDGTCVRLFTTKRSFTEDVEHSTLLFDQERVRPFPFQYQDLQEDPTGAAGSEPLSVVAAES